MSKYLWIFFFNALALLLFSSQGTAQTPPAEPNPVATEIQQLNSRVAELYRAGKIEEAWPVAEKSLALSEKTFGPDDFRLSVALHNLGELGLALKKYGNAQTCLQRALTLNEKKFGVESPEVARLLGRLALAAFGNGKRGVAEEALLRALPIQEKLAGPESVGVMKTLADLTDLYRMTGKYDKALPLYQRLFELKKKLATDRMEVYLVAARYSCIRRRMGEPIQTTDIMGEVKGEQDNTLPRKTGVVNGKALSLERPYYPPEAKQARAQGKVSVEVIIDEQGQVIHACAISGVVLLWQAAEDAAFRSRFSPTTVDGKPVKVTGEINYNFVALG